MSLVFYNATAQSDLDSLKVIIDNPKTHDTTKLKTLSFLIVNLQEESKVLFYSEKMGKIAQKNLVRKDIPKTQHQFYKKYLAAYFDNLSLYYAGRDIIKALKYLDQSIVLYKAAESENNVYFSYLTKGDYLTINNQKEEAIIYYFKALKYFEKNKEKFVDGISYTYSCLGSLYEAQNQHKTAINYFKKSLFYLDKKKTRVSVDDEIQRFLLNYNIGSVYVIQKQYESAKKYLNIALFYSRKHKNDSYSSLALGRLGMIELHSNKLDAAENKLIEANSLSLDNTSKSFTLINLGEVYYKKKNYVKAERALLEGLKSNVSLKSNKLNKQAFKILHEIYKDMGRYKEALSVYEQFISINDETVHLETKNELKQQELKYDFEKKVLNLKLLAERKSATKNNLLIGLSSILFLLSLGGYFLYRNAKQKQAISFYEKNELKQKLLLSQMNPHFIFNSIDNIQSLIYNKQEDEAVRYLTKFSKLTRQILENSTENYITLEEELAMMDNYLTIQRLLYNNKFEFTIISDNILEVEYILVPPMITQPFIENAIKHGLKNTSVQGKITIVFGMVKNKLMFTIEDNGDGFQEVQKESAKKSMAIKITKERLRSISKKSDFEVHTENILDRDKKIIGAKVFFEIPYLFEK